jgi:hypothetical protein
MLEAEELWVCSHTGLHSRTLFPKKKKEKWLIEICRQKCPHFGPSWVSILISLVPPVNDKTKHHPRIPGELASKKQPLVPKKACPRDLLPNWVLSSPMISVNFHNDHFLVLLPKADIKTTPCPSPALRHSHRQPGSMSLSLNFVCWMWESLVRFLLWAAFS